MIDLHAHILPSIDDGADSIGTSLEMLRMSYAQGVDAIVATPHYYADEEYPDRFLERRRNSMEMLQDAMHRESEAGPDIILGAEVLYFPGICEARDVASLNISGTDAILIEPPMVPWRSAMLDDIADIKPLQGYTPIIAHVDRFMNYLRDDSLIDRVLERGMLVQVNADYFLNPKTARKAFRNLKKGKIHFIGSDCHNLSQRLPNLGAARQAAIAHRMPAEFWQLTDNSARLLGL